MTQKYKIVTIDGEDYASPSLEYWDNIRDQKYQILLKRSYIPEFY